MAPVPQEQLVARFRRYRNYLARHSIDVWCPDIPQGGGLYGEWGTVINDAPQLPISLALFDANDNLIEIRHGGQYSYNDAQKRPFSMTAGQPGCPPGFALTQGTDYVEYTIAFDPGYPNGGMTGDYSLRFRVRQDHPDHVNTLNDLDPANQVRIQIWTETEVPLFARTDVSYAKLIFGKQENLSGYPQIVTDKVYPYLPPNYYITYRWLALYQISTLDYPSRHCFSLGEALASFDGGITYPHQFSRQQAGYTQDVYDVLFGLKDYEYPDYFVFGRDAWPDCYAPTQNVYGDRYKEFTSLPQGAFSYPHQSKVAHSGAQDLWLFGLTTLPLYRMLWMIHLLKKYRNPERQFTNPMVASLLPGIPVPITVNALQIADEAIEYWNLTVPAGIGYPPSVHQVAIEYVLKKAAHLALPGVFPMPVPGETVAVDIGASYPTAIFAIYMTILGYGYGYERFQPYADAAMEVLGKATWGDLFTYGPSGCLGHIKQVGATSFYRANHAGGVMTAWKPFEGDPTNQFSFYHDSSIADFFFYATPAKILQDSGAPSTGNPVEDYHAFWAQLAHQNANEPCFCPTSMEATALTCIATAYYLSFVYNYHGGEPYVDWSVFNWLEPRVYGRVVNASGQPIPNASVWLLGGTVTTPPEQPNTYGVALTDQNGNYSIPYHQTGDHTVFVKASGTCALKPATILQNDQVIRWPDVTL